MTGTVSATHMGGQDSSKPLSRPADWGLEASDLDGFGISMFTHLRSSCLESAWGATRLGEGGYGCPSVFHLL